MFVSKTLLPQQSLTLPVSKYLRLALLVILLLTLGSIIASFFIREGHHHKTKSSSTSSLGDVTFSLESNQFIINPIINGTKGKCPLLRTPSDHEFPSEFFDSFWKRPQHEYDGRGFKLFKKSKHVKIVKSLELSAQDVYYYANLVPYKLSEKTESEICKPAANDHDAQWRRPYLIDMTDKCKESSKRQFREGTFCAKIEQKAWIVEIECAWVDESSFHHDVSWATFTDEGIIAQVQLGYGWKPTIQKYFRVRHFEKLANPGCSVLPYANGHMPVEILPRMVRLWNELPLDIPLIWPNNPVAERYLRIMEELQVIVGKRYLVTQELKTVMRANKLYLYHADDDNFPHMNALEYQYLNSRITQGMHNKFPNLLSLKKKKIITLIDRRAQTRNLQDHASVLLALKKEFPDCEVREYVIGSAKDANEFIRTTAKIFYETDIMISPHGASLSNILFTRAGTGVIELGWGALPQDYMCFARNMKFKYMLVAGEGHHDSLYLKISAQEIIYAVKTLLNDMI
ncbi:hypothetical protein C9374_001505 [Naegleria lovaniensis]|uniref:Glycosyltransferase 61 catalytic domain-containing protein n=1 Tax=Naegleria lovaniensis TaxID=51637 RepID=A0AA88KM15_NAELO|nr:uncharacterized protein C9374_001505 [Naegleria lovaniensis]KAG2387173.1 hypothetical protein C9374_001505 [Naegleria lovaniensis]